MMCVGDNGNKQLGQAMSIASIGTSTNAVSSVPFIPFLDGATAITPDLVSTASSETCVFFSGLGVKCFGAGTSALPAGSLPWLGTYAGEITQLSAGSAFHVALYASGQVLAWGSNVNGECLAGTAVSLVSFSSASFLGLPQTVTALDAGANHVCVIYSINLVSCCKIIKSITQNYSKITQFKKKKKKKKIGGKNNKGQLGNGDTVTVYSVASLLPITFKNADSPVAVALGGEFSCALFAVPSASATDPGSNRIRCWGSGAVGATGGGTLNEVGDVSGEVSSINYIAFSDTASVTSLAAGNDFACAIFANTDGLYPGSPRARCWGNNALGQLMKSDGLATLTVGSRPTDMSNLGYIDFGSTAPVLEVAAGAAQVCVRFYGAGIACLGGNLMGALGLNTDLNSVILTSGTFPQTINFGQRLVHGLSPRAVVSPTTSLTLTVIGALFDTSASGIAGTSVTILGVTTTASAVSATEAVFTNVNIPASTPSALVAVSIVLYGTPSSTDNNFQMIVYSGAATVTSVGPTSLPYNVAMGVVIMTLFGTDFMSDSLAAPACNFGSYGATVATVFSASMVTCPAPKIATLPSPAVVAFRYMEDGVSAATGTPFTLYVHDHVTVQTSNNTLSLGLGTALGGQRIAINTDAYNPTAEAPLVKVTVVATPSNQDYFGITEVATGATANQVIFTMPCLMFPCSSAGSVFSGIALPQTVTLTLSYSTPSPYYFSASSSTYDYTFTYYALPTLSLLSPQGFWVGETSMEIAVTGTNFPFNSVVPALQNVLAGTICRLNSTSAVLAPVGGTGGGNFATGMRCSVSTVPPAGAYLFDVSFNGGAEYTNPVLLYVFSLVSVTPSGGPISDAAGTSITIAGVGFTGAAALSALFGVGASAQDFPASFISSTAIRAQATPSGFSAGVAYSVNAALDVSHPSTSTALSFKFYTNPATSSVALTPTYLPSLIATQVAGSVKVTITGTAFPVVSTGATCKIGSASALAAVVTSTSVVCPAPILLPAGEQPVVILFNGQNEFSTGLVLKVFQVTSVDPPCGPASGGTVLSLQASNLPNPSPATLAGWVCNFLVAGAASTVQRNATLVSSSLITCAAPAVSAASFAAGSPSALAADLTVGNSRSPVVYTYYPAPAVTAISPQGGVLTGLTRVTVYGANFLTAAPGSIAGCRFGTGTFISASDAGPTNTSMVCLSPEGVSSVSVEVSLNNGKDYSSNGVKFTYFALDSVSPATGPTAGGTAVTLSGQGFSSAAAIRCRFGAVEVPAQAVIDSLRCTCLTPSVASSSNTTLAVSANGGASYTATVAFSFYQQPVWGEPSPRSGPAEGGTAVTVQVSGAAAAALTPSTVTVFFNSDPASGVPATWLSAGAALRFTTTRKATGSTPVSISLNGLLADAALVAQPFWFFSMASLSPARGPVTGGTTVSVTGDGFLAPVTNTTASAYRCMVNSAVMSRPATVVSSTSITCVLDSLTGVVATSNANANVTVTTDLALSRSVPIAFAVYQPPVVTAVSPGSLPSSGGLLTIFGTGLTGTSCKAGEVKGAMVSGAGGVPGNDTAAVCRLPASARATVNVSVSGNDQQYSETVQPFNITACLPGTSAALDTDPCVPCDAGTFAKDSAMRACDVCPDATYQDEKGQAECKKCPANTVSSARPTSLSECRCAAGFHSPTGATGVDCEACPAGALCAGGAEPAVAREGYWASNSLRNVFLACSPRDACPGGKAGACAPGYGGRLCSVCAPGYFRLNNLCNPCPRAAPTILVVFVLFSIGICVALIKAAGKRTKALSGTIAVSTKFFQVISIFGRIDVNWPKSVKDTIAVITAPFNLKFDTLAPECSAPSIRYESKWAFTVLLPVFFGLLFALAYVALRFIGRRRDMGARVIGGYLTLLNLGYLTLALTAMEPFGCVREEDGTYSLVVDPARLCFAPWWDRIAGPAALATFLYVFLWPALVLLFLRKNQSRLHEQQFFARFGGLYGAYKDNLSFWEPIVMLEKTLIAAIQLFFASYVSIQIVLFMGIFTAGLSVYQFHRPFLSDRDNQLQDFLRWCSLCILFAAALFKVGDFPTSAARSTIEVLACSLIVSGTAACILRIALNASAIWAETRHLGKVDKEVERVVGDAFLPQERVKVLRWVLAGEQEEAGLDRNRGERLVRVFDAVMAAKGNEGKEEVGEGYSDPHPDVDSLPLVVLAYGGLRPDALSKAKAAVLAGRGGELIDLLFDLARGTLDGSVLTAAAAAPAAANPLSKTVFGVEGAALASCRAYLEAVRDERILRERLGRQESVPETPTQRVTSLPPLKIAPKKGRRGQGGRGQGGRGQGGRGQGGRGQGGAGVASAGFAR
jgi:hypothetical protein